MTFSKLKETCVSPVCVSARTGFLATPQSMFKKKLKQKIPLLVERMQIGVSSEVQAHF